MSWPRCGEGNSHFLLDLIELGFRDPTGELKGTFTTDGTVPLDVLNASLEIGFRCKRSDERLRFLIVKLVMGVYDIVGNRMQLSVCVTDAPEILAVIAEQLDDLGEDFCRKFIHLEVRGAMVTSNRLTRLTSS